MRGESDSAGSKSIPRYLSAVSWLHFRFTRAMYGRSRRGLRAHIAVGALEARVTACSVHRLFTQHGFRVTWPVYSVSIHEWIGMHHERARQRQPSLQTLTTLPARH